MPPSAYNVLVIIELEWNDVSSRETLCQGRRVVALSLPECHGKRSAVSVLIIYLHAEADIGNSVYRKRVARSSLGTNRHDFYTPHQANGEAKKRIMHGTNAPSSSSTLEHQHSAPWQRLRRYPLAWRFWRPCLRFPRSLAWVWFLLWLLLLSCSWL